MLSPVTSAGVTPVKPNALSPDTPKPRPEEMSRDRTAPSAPARTEAAPAADRARPAPPRWEPDPIKPSPTGTPLFEPATVKAGGDDEEALARPRPDAEKPGLSNWEPDPFRPAPEAAAKLTPATVKAGGDDEEAIARPRPDAFEEKAVVARPSPAETAALRQATEGYAQLGSYAAIQNKLSIST